MLERAQASMAEDDYVEAYLTLQPLIDFGSTEAAYLAASFALPNESDAQFDSRRLWLLNRSAAGGYASALYELALMHDLGDQVLRDPSIASRYFALAAKAGDTRAMLSHGLDLISGANGVQKDERQARQYLEQAAHVDIAGAREALERLEDGSKSGSTD